MKTNLNRGSRVQIWIAQGRCSSNLRFGGMTIPPGPAVVLFLPFVMLFVLINLATKGKP